ncbi:hypothetical protein Desor_1113 [Desulfosporosinus orientis DSM 765]|uniref:Uncharacterized protein n=2 Tax=Desulfosporosinus orientis TaxID=1563 RepID=G7WAL8_DESOD|nr:hypothetical protein Desor_1113 [Desulfosporosinus orientis DSM 765]
MRRRGKGSLMEWFWLTVQRSERRIIRVMVLASVLLLVMQLSAVKDPLDFYMTVAAKVEAPPLDLPALAPPEAETAVKTWTITLRAVPVAPIRVVQDGTVLATLGKGEQQIAVHSGQIQLDGIGVPQIVKVQVVKKDAQLNEPRQNQVMIIQGNIQNFAVKP